MQKYNGRYCYVDYSTIFILSEIGSMFRPHNCLLVGGGVVELLTLSVLPNVQYNKQSTVALGGSTPAFLKQEVNLILTSFHLKKIT